MNRRVLWIDDNEEVLTEGASILRSIGGIDALLARSSSEAQQALESGQVDTVIMDILRRNADRGIAGDDGYEFFTAQIRPAFPTLHVIFHTKNLPSSFAVDDNSGYLSKWESTEKKRIELERRLVDQLRLYEACVDFSTWSLIEPRLIQLNFALLEKLRAWDDVFRLTPDEFEQLVGEVLDNNGFSVLWVPGGKDGGIDIVASSSDCDYLIDVKRWHAKRPVTIELVRQVYGIAEAVAKSKDDRGFVGGIITSSRFTQDAEDWQKTLRPRPLLRDGDWLRQELRKHAPRMRTPY